jgi:polyisoprenoid-binding protein YceI
MATAMQPFAGIYELDRAHSTVQFGVRHQQISTFRASFDDVDARSAPTAPASSCERPSTAEAGR